MEEEGEYVEKKDQQLKKKDPSDKKSVSPIMKPHQNLFVNKMQKKQ